MLKIIQLLFTLLLILPNFYQCNKIVESVAEWFVSDSEEVALGTQFYNQIKSDPKNYPIIDTVGNWKYRLLVNYIDSITRVIVKNQNARPENKHLKYKVSVINDTTVNAFAIPGGYIFIYTGLIKVASDEAQIAGVLAHELGHITQRHGVKKLVEMMGIKYVQQLIFGNDPNLIIEAMTALLFLKFSRENEFEADSCAIDFLISAGYNPKGMKTFLQLLAQNSSWSFEPLSTHPDNEKRINAVTTIISNKPESVNNLPLPDNKAKTEGWLEGVLYKTPQNNKKQNLY